MKRALIILVVVIFELFPINASASLNGKEDFSETRVVGVSVSQSIGTGSWINGSGYLYSPRIVFSAGHGKDSNPSGIYYVSQPNQEIRPGMSTVKVIKAYYPETYKPKIYSNDFSVLVLEKPLMQIANAPLITPLLLEQVIATRNPMKILGFGVYQDVCLQLNQSPPCRFQDGDKTSFVPRSIEMTPWNSSEIQNKFHQYDPEISDHLFFTGPYRSGPCPGDSGGPTTAQINGIDYYVGTVPTGFWNAYACGQSPGYEGETLGWTAPVYKFLDLIAEAEKYVAEHPYVEPSPSAAIAQNTNIVYRYLTELAKGWAKFSRTVDTGKKQCTSARDYGIILKIGRTTSLGVKEKSIRRDLMTSVGFKACLDGFKK